MQIGMVGLGRMGANMVRRLLRRGHEAVVFDRSPDAVEAVVRGGRRRSLVPRGHGEPPSETASGVAHGASRRG